MNFNKAYKELDIIRFNPHWDELVKEEYWEDIMETAMKAVKKQIPMEPVLKTDEIRYIATYHCPVCGKGITGTNIAQWCYHCGQKMKWKGQENE